MSEAYFMGLLLAGGACVGFAVNALLLLRQSRQRAHAHFAVLALLEGAYCVVAYRYFRETRPEAAIAWARAICVFTPFITCVFGFLVMDLTRRGQPWPRWFRIYQTINLVLTTAFAAQVLVDALAGTALVLTGVVETDLASRHRHRVSFAPLGEAWLAWVSVSFVLFTVILVRGARTRRQLVPVTAGCAAYFAATISDFGVLSNAYDAYFVQHAGFFALVAGCWWALAARYERSLRDLRSAIARLEDERRRLLVSTPLAHRHKLDGMGALAAGIAHEIHGPIQGIMNYAALLRRQLNEPAEREFAAEILAECGRVTGIVKGLLSYARADDGQIGGVRPYELVLEVARLLASTLAADGTRLEIDVDDALPELHEGAQRLKQVVMNLLTNARDALVVRDPARRDPKVIRVVGRAGTRATDGDDAGERAGDEDRGGEAPEGGGADGARWVSVEVIDNADGIDEATLGRIFEPFFTTKPPGRGTGLGLAISREIATGLGGRLVCRSRRGEGSRFRVEIPVRDVTRRRDGAGPPTSAAAE